MLYLSEIALRSVTFKYAKTATYLQITKETIINRVLTYILKYYDNIIHKDLFLGHEKITLAKATFLSNLSSQVTAP